MKWERLEEWLYETHTLGGGSFTSLDVANGLDVPRHDATRYIRSYLDAQRAQSSRTLYVLHRSGRTSRAVWSVGVRSADARATSHQFFDDIQQRFVRAVEPDLVRIATLNPRARRKCEAIIGAVATGAMQLLRVAVDGIDADDEEAG